MDYGQNSMFMNFMEFHAIFLPIASLHHSLWCFHVLPPFSPMAQRHGPHRPGRTLLEMISHTASITVSLFTSSDKVSGDETMAHALKWERASKNVKPGGLVKPKKGRKWMKTDENG